MLNRHDMAAPARERRRPRWIILLATGLYAGYVPAIPGTAGSVVGLVLAWAAFAPLWRYSPAVCLLVFALSFGAGCWVAGRAEEALGQRDSPHIVIDEILGMVATTFFNPIRWPWLAAGFLAFRFFDIVKPFPAGSIDRRLQGGLGVMLDDLVAAVYANIVLQVLVRIV
jgi:phosphatidylglycerophosphatase A